VSEVRTRDEALVAVDRGLAQWAAAAAGVLVQAAATASGAQSAAEAEVRRRAARIAALEALRSSLRPGAETRALDREIDQARTAHRTAVLAAQRIAEVAQRIAALRRSQAMDGDARTGAARADLARMLTGLAAYHGLTVGRAGSSLGSSPAPAPARGGESWLAGLGLTEFDVAQVDFSDNPILGSLARSDDLTLADYRWAVQAWDQVVRPGLSRGMSRADFAARDAERGAPQWRRTADVYDLFLGSKVIHLARREDGTLDPGGGRRRIAIARELGIGHLPGKVTER
jgi:hypothetical protein